MEWTTEVPNRNGYYWAYEDLPDVDADTIIVQCTMADWGVRVRSIFDTVDARFDIHDFSHWYGPLDVPSPPDVTI